MDSLQIAAIAFAFSQLILSGLLLILGSCQLIAQRILAVLLFAVAAFLIEPLLQHTALAWIPSTVSTAVPGLFWLFYASLFDDHFTLQWWHVGLVALTVIPPFVALIMHGFNIVGFDTLLITAPQILELVLLALALFVIARNSRVDLIEPRRNLRMLMLGLNGLHMFLLVLFLGVLFPEAEWMQWLQYVSVGAILLATNSVFLNYRSNIWNSTSSTMGSGDEKGTRVDAPAVVQSVDEQEVDPILVEQLETLMEGEKIYREMGLTIGQLASRLNIPEYRLRRVINTGLKYRNFNDFLNCYRINEASQRLADPAQQDLQVLVIALETGFRSLSSFNKTFKECYQLTPTAFRRQSLSILNCEASDHNGLS